MKRKNKQRMEKEEQIPFKCLNCGITEDIPKEAVDFFIRWMREMQVCHHASNVRNVVASWNPFAIPQMTE